MGYQIKIGSSASREIKKLDRRSQIQVIERLEAMQKDPRPKGVEKLSQNPRFYRIRSGDYRIVYNIDDEIDMVYIVVVRHRREAYRGLQDLDTKLIAAILAPVLPLSP